MPEITTPAVLESATQQKADRMAGKVGAQPRLRIEKNTNLALSTTWQRINLSDSNTLNVNTFGTDTSQSNPMVQWDSTNKLVKFNFTEDRNYLCELFIAATCSSRLTSVAASPIRLQYRWVVSNGRGTGLDFYFPYPGSDGSNGYGDLTISNLTDDIRVKTVDLLYAGTSLRTHGVGLDLRLSASPVVGSITLNLATLIIYGSL